MQIRRQTSMRCIPRMGSRKPGEGAHTCRVGGARRVRNTCYIKMFPGKVGLPLQRCGTSAVATDGGTAVNTPREIVVKHNPIYRVQPSCPSKSVTLCSAVALALAMLATPSTSELSTNTATSMPMTVASADDKHGGGNA